MSITLCPNTHSYYFTPKSKSIRNDKQGFDLNSFKDESTLSYALLRYFIDVEYALSDYHECVTVWKRNSFKYYKWNTLSNNWNNISFLFIERYYKYFNRRKNKMSRNLVGIGKPAGKMNGQKNNSLSQILPETAKGGFGIQVAQIRILLGQTQNSFAKMLLTTRQSIVALEKCNDPEELSDGMLFRVYYLVKEILENAYAPNLLFSVSKEVLNSTRQCIEDKVNS